MRKLVTFAAEMRREWIIRASEGRKEGCRIALPLHGQESAEGLPHLPAFYYDSSFSRVE
jgi:hypothetical protein